MTAGQLKGDRDPLQPLLVRMLGPGAEFRDGQREAIEAVLRGERTLVVQRTGWGKSIVYWMATRVLRDRGRGPTLVISPLLSLMRNQIDAAKHLGLRPATIHSGNREEWQATREGLLSNSVDVLLVSPERLGNELSVREMARLQSFPDTFTFYSKVTTGGKARRREVPQYTQVGNAAAVDGLPHWAPAEATSRRTGRPRERVEHATRAR